VAALTGGLKRLMIWVGESVEKKRFKNGEKIRNLI
jgi:hypothetical protein